MPFDLSPPDTFTETQRILLKAAEIIEERGWCQGNPRDGRICVMKAIELATGIEPDGFTAVNYGPVTDHPASQQLLAYLGLPPKQLGLSTLWQWNDNENRTKAEVIQALRDAALKEG